VHQIAAIFLAVLQADSGQGTSFGLQLSVWKWVVLIGAGAVVAAYAVKRIADIATVKKTEAIIARVGNGEQDVPAVEKETPAASASVEEVREEANAEAREEARDGKVGAGEGERE